MTSDTYQVGAIRLLELPFDLEVAASKRQDAGTLGDGTGSRNRSLQIVLAIEPIAVRRTASCKTSV